MSLSDLAALGSFVSGVAVVITLVMLLLQMRQTNKNQRASMQLGRATRGTELLTRLIDTEFARIWRKAWTSSEPLSGTELFVWLSYANAMFFNWQDTFLQYRAGLLDKISMEADETVIRQTMTSPAMQAIWEYSRGLWGQEFTQYLDRIITEVQLIQPVDTDPFYHAIYRDLLSKAKPFSPGAPAQTTAKA